MSADLVMMDARRIASATTKVRERLLVALFNGQIDADTDLSSYPSAQAFRDFTSTIQAKAPNKKGAKLAGGLGKHYDLTVHFDSETMKKGELKVTAGNPSSLDILTWCPWKDTVQFLQAQVKAKIAKKFLGDCGEPMLITWFEQVVKPFSSRVPAASGMTCAGYLKAMSTIGMKGKQEESAKALITALRTDEALQKELHGAWLAFESQWLSCHTMDHEGLLTVLKDVLDVKDFWVCASKTQVLWIDGFKVIGLNFVAAKPKPKGGHSFHYTMTLQRGAETKEVPLECKFHWKNGGQAVQNLNVMLL
jgi:hypothetical protein